jgi:hypothetical protein
MGPTLCYFTGGILLLLPLLLMRRIKNDNVGVESQEKESGKVIKAE